MSLRDVREALETWERRGDPAAVATLIAVRRSAPRNPGARFAVSGSGDLAGSVSSGCVEGDLHEHLTRLLGGGDPEIITYGITDDMAAGVGLSCGGEIDVLLEAHPAADPVWGRLDRALDEGVPAALVTGVAEPIRGRRLLLVSTGAGPDTGDPSAGDPQARVETTGSLGSDELDRAAHAAALVPLGRSRTSLARLVEDDPGSEVFIETFAPPPRLAIVGATPIAEALCRFAATVGFDVVVIDPRAAFARAERFPDASGVIVEWPDAAFERIGLDRHANVVLLTHDGKIDDPALAAALDAGCGYVGLLGGGRTQRQRREALAAAGYDEAAIARIHGPVGLDIGADTPEQIAVSILAELIAEGRAP